jgi:hypothetical protein
VHPDAHVLDALVQVLEPRTHGFETQEGQRGPVRRHLVDHERVQHRVEFGRHQRNAQDRVLEALQRVDHLRHQAVELFHLHEQKVGEDAQVARAVSLQVFLGDLGPAEEFWDAVELFVDHVKDDVVTAATTFVVASAA